MVEALIRILRGVSPREAGLESLRCARCRDLYLGHGYEVAGDAPRAIEPYEAYLADGFFDASLYELHFLAPVVHERLGALYDQVGDSEEAAEHYREFARRWADADPKLQLRVQYALERAGGV